ncbi:MAG: hypothetical protein WC760_06455 [Bacteroidia bacterium]|jgi:hypothetical protein
MANQQSYGFKGGLIAGKQSLLSIADSKGIKKEPVAPTATDSADYAVWGTDNTLPAEIITQLGKNEIAFRACEFNKSVHLGAGIVYYKEVVKDGQPFAQYFKDSEIDDWFLENEVNEWLFKAFVEDYETLGNIFPEHILSNDRKKIVRLMRHDASWCRWGKQDSSSREIKKLFINSDWEADRKSDRTEVEVLNSRFPLMDLQSKKGFNYIQRIRPVSNGRYYYELANVEVLINSETLAIAADLKTTLKAILKNQILPMWHIEITEDYLQFRFGKKEFEKIQNDAKRYADALTEVKNEIDEYLAGAANAGKTITSSVMYDRQGKKIPGVEITPLKNQLEKGAWIPDQEFYANSIYQGMGVDASSVGGFSNQNRTMNSGSEKKNSFQISSATFMADQMITLAPLVFVARYNEWFKRHPGLKFAVNPSPFIQTLNSKDAE